MHFALQEGKRLLHYRPSYSVWMVSANERLQQARINAGFATAVDAADALGVPRSTYIGHENGHRGFPAKRAPQYARRFKVSEEWLLYGKGEATEPTFDPTVSDIEQMIREVIEAEITLGTRLADLPRIVAPALHEQIERFRSDRERQARVGPSTALGTGAQSPVATK